MPQPPNSPQPSPPSANSPYPPNTQATQGQLTQQESPPSISHTRSIQLPNEGANSTNVSPSGTATHSIYLGRPDMSGPDDDQIQPTRFGFQSDEDREYWRQMKLNLHGKKVRCSHDIRAVVEQIGSRVPPTIPDGPCLQCQEEWKAAMRRCCLVM